VVTIGCANLRMKQGRGDDYISVSLTSSNSGGHKGWFYLRNDPEFVLLSYTGNSIAESRRSWVDGPPRRSRRKSSRTTGRAGASLRSQSHHSGSDRAISRPRCRATPEAAASPLRDDGRPGPLGGDRDRSVAPVVSRGPALRGAGNREVDLLMAAVEAAPQHGDRKSCELFIFSMHLICFCRDVDLLGACLPRLTFTPSCRRS
jgi:hypothetical protein